MKTILLGILMTIFSITGMTQQKIGTPFAIKKGEVITVHKLRIKYLDNQKEWATGWDSEGKRLEIEYNRYHFEIEINGKKVEVKEVFNFKTGDFVVEILGKHIAEKTRRQ